MEAPVSKPPSPPSKSPKSSSASAAEAEVKSESKEDENDVWKPFEADEVEATVGVKSSEPKASAPEEVSGHALSCELGERSVTLTPGR